jgi:hypothetical protein
MKIQTWIIVSDGKKEVHEKEKFQESLNSLKDGQYIYTVEEVCNTRSLDQNNAIWGIPYLFFTRALVEMGHFKNPSKEQIHEWCMYHCLPEDYKERIKKEWEDSLSMVDMKTGELFKTPFRLTTKKMTTTDAINYYSNLQQFYAEKLASGSEEDYIPDPIPSLKKVK